MPRVKRGTTSNKRRKKILKAAKGFMWGRKSKERLAREALLHSWSRAFSDRRKKKGDFRKIWQSKIKAATEMSGMKYSKFISSLKKNNINLDRKSLSELAENYSDIFKKLVDRVK